MTHRRHSCRHRDDRERRDLRCGGLCFSRHGGVASRRVRAMSLLELIIALAVLVGTASLLMQVVDLGSHHADRAQQITDAQTVAHNLMAEHLAGIRGWDATETYQPVDTWSPWEYQLRIAPIGFGDLASATLTVAPRANAPAPPTDGALPSVPSVPASTPAESPTAQLSQLDTESLRPGSYRLTRWIHKPSTDRREAMDLEGDY